jgi:hypothetical protein
VIALTLITGSAASGAGAADVAGAKTQATNRTAEASIATTQAHSEETARSKLPDPPDQRREGNEPLPVHIGMHVLRLAGLDITNNQFTLDFWLWFRWQDDSLKPYESFELTNGKIESSHVERVDKVGDVHYACVRVLATLNCFWDVSRFPLSSQELTVEIEDDDLEADQLVYLPDRENCGVDGNLRAAGWALDGFSGETCTHVYTTNYGDPRHSSGKETRFCRSVFSLRLRRADLFHAFKVFGTLYLSALVAFTVFFVKPEHRLPLTVGAVFSVVASHTVLASYLPDAGVFTLADQLHLVTAGLILFSLFETAYSLHLVHTSREGASKRLDRASFLITAPLFLLANAYLLMR